MSPLIANDTYRPPFPFRQRHLATSLPTLLRQVPDPGWERCRVTLPDGDFLDLDLAGFGAALGRPVVVLCHGLEGNSDRQYMRGMARAFLGQGWAVAGVNYRGCSGEPNLKPYSYHSGATADLRAVLDHLQAKGHPVRALVGFSLGGNLILKYLGEDPAGVLASLSAAVVFSVPVDLSSGERQLRRKENFFYNRRFLRKLARKIRQKAELFPGQVDPSHLDRVKTLWDFDEHYTGPLSGFAGAGDYYRRCSSRQFLPDIQLPTLLVSARDDPFLGASCYPVPEAEQSSFFHLETPRFGGHVGFHQPGGTYFSESKAVDFVLAVNG